MYRPQLSLSGVPINQQRLPFPQPFFVMHWQQPLITQGYGTMQSGPSMPFSTHAGPSTSIYPMGHWQQHQNQNHGLGYNAPFRVSTASGPTYPMGQRHQNPQGLGYNAPFRVGTQAGHGPTYPMGQQHRNPQGLGYNAPFRVDSGPTTYYPMGQQHRNPSRNYRNQVPLGLGYSAPFSAGHGPVYPTGRQHVNHQQYRTRNHWQAPSSGPSRNRRKRYRKAEPQYKNHIHESSGSVVNDRSTGVDPGTPRIGASNETRAGKTIKPHVRDYRDTRDRRWRPNPSVYQIPSDMGFKSDMPVADASGPTPAPSGSPSAQPTSTPTPAIVQDPEDDDDLDTVSLGSED